MLAFLFYSPRACAFECFTWSWRRSFGLDYYKVVHNSMHVCMLAVSCRCSGALLRGTTRITLTNLKHFLHTAAWYVLITIVNVVAYHCELDPVAPKHGSCVYTTKASPMKTFFEPIGPHKMMVSPVSQDNVCPDWNGNMNRLQNAKRCLQVCAHHLKGVQWHKFIQTSMHLRPSRSCNCILSKPSQPYRSWVPGTPRWHRPRLAAYGHCDSGGQNGR